MTVQEKQTEQQINAYWIQESKKYKTTVENLSAVRAYILTAARCYYDNIKSKATNNGTSELAEVREFRGISGEEFPHQLKTNEIAMAWVMKVGDIPDMLKRLLPNQAMPGLTELRPVHFENRAYDYSRPGLHALSYQGRLMESAADYRIPLVLFRYALLCDKQGYDRLNAVEISKPGKLIQSGIISIDTEYYNINILFNKKGNYFEFIDINPKENLLNRNMK